MKKFLTLTLALVIILFCSSCGSSGGKAESFFNTFSGGTYYMKAKMIGDYNTETTIETYVKDGMIATTAESDSQISRTIIRDGKMYMIIDSEKMYMVSDASGNVASEYVQTEGMKASGLGTDEFGGKSLSYEEYSDDDGNISQYFIDGNKLAGIRNIIGGITMDIVILELNKNVPNSVFDIPSDYQEMGV